MVKPTRDIPKEPEQEPVAWQVMVEDEAMKEFPIKDMAHDWCVHQKLSGSSYVYWIRPLYTHPPVPKDEQVEPVAKVNFYTGKIEWLMPVSFDIPVTIDVPPMYLYTHLPLPTAQERNFCPRCGKRLGQNDWNVHTCTPPQPKEPEQEPVAFELYHHIVLKLAEAGCKLSEQQKMVLCNLKAVTTPPQRKPITDEQAMDAYCETPPFGTYAEAFIAGIRFIEAAHGIKE